MAQTTDIASLSITEASRLIRTRGVSPLELTRACLARIERLNPCVNAFITVTGEQALAQAEQLEEEAMHGRWRGPLHGIPIALKDNIDTAGVLTTGASAVFAERVPTEDAEVVMRLNRAGAILLGKLNMHEFAYGTTSVISHYGPVHNPWNRNRIAGGSSGGSAAAVAAGLCFGALGTDTGGSIRLPAACCGIVGLKPTYGLVSTRGVVPLAWTLDHVGPMCRTVEDSALLLSAIAGYDPQEPTSVDIAIPEYAAALQQGKAGIRIGLPTNFVTAEEMQCTMEGALDVFRSLGAAVQEVEIPEIAGLAAFAEVYAFHADCLKQMPESYAPETLARIEERANIMAVEYITARREIEQARRTSGRIFAEIDVLIVPTAPGAAPLITECHVPSALPIHYTLPFNYLGLPAISIPCGHTTDGMPLGLQIIGPHGGEATVLALAHQYEQATSWHHQRPPLEEIAWPRTFDRAGTDVHRAE